MKIAWRLLVALGVLVVVASFTMDTTVGRVHNLGLLQLQQMLLVLGCVMFLAGIVLFAVVRPRTARHRARPQSGTKATTLKLRVPLAQLAYAVRLLGTVLRTPLTDRPLARILAAAVAGATSCLVSEQTASWAWYTLPSYGLVIALWPARAEAVLRWLYRLSTAIAVITLLLLINVFSRERLGFNEAVILYLGYASMTLIMSMSGWWYFSFARSGNSRHSGQQGRLVREREARNDLH